MNSYKAYLYITHLVFTVVLTIVLNPFASKAFASEAVPNKKWIPRFTFEYRPDRSRSLARFDALIPLRQTSNTLFFSDLRYIESSGPGLEGNLGLGYRSLRHDLPVLGGDWILGGYAFFDRRKTSFENYFSQLTFGGELMTIDWSFRANGYLPEKEGYVVRTRSTPDPGPTLSGTTVIGSVGGTSLADKEWALPGFDLEFGYRIQTIPNHALWLYAGYFHFDRAETPRISGPRARIEYRMHELFNWIGSQMTLGVEVREDDIAGTDGLVLARLSIPIGKTSKTLMGLEQRMMEFIQRDVDVVTLVNVEEVAPGSAGSPPIAVDPESGETLNVYVVSQDGTGDCTQDNPCTIADVENDSNYGAGDVMVLVDASGFVIGDIDLTTTVASLGSDRRQVVGGEGDIVINLSSGDNLRLSDLGGRPTLEGSVVLGNASRLIGFDMLSPGTAISGANLDDLVIQDINVVNAGNNALRLQGLISSASLTDFSVQQVGGSAIDLSGTSGSIDFENLNISGLGSGTGLDLRASSSIVTVNMLNISGTSAPDSIGIDLRGASGALISNSGGTIQNVVTAFDFDATTNATVSFQNGNINAGIPVNAVDVVNGSYDFSGTTFMKDNVLSLETGFGGTMFFVDATGDGPGTPENPTSIDFAEANTNLGDIILLVEDGTGNIFATEGFQLQDNQQLLGFAAGDATMDFTGVHPLFSGQFVYAVSDPTGLGGATLNNIGGTVTLSLASGVQLRDFSISTTGIAHGIAGNNFTGAIIRNIDVSDAGNHGLQISNASGELLISDLRINNSVREAFEINGGNATLIVENLSINNARRGIWLDGIEGDATFSGLVDITLASGNAVTAINLGTSTVSFNDRLDISTESGSGLVIEGGHFNISGGSINASETGIIASNTAVNIVLDTLSASVDTELHNVTGPINILDRP